MGQTEASRVFQMSQNTIDLWLKRRERENTLAPEVRHPDRDEFQDFVDAHRDWSQEQMGQELGVSASCVGRAMAKAPR